MSTSAEYTFTVNSQKTLVAHFTEEAAGPVITALSINGTPIESLGEAISRNMVYAAECDETTVNLGITATPGATVTVAVNGVPAASNPSVTLHDDKTTVVMMLNDGSLSNTFTLQIAKSFGSMEDPMYLTRWNNKVLTVISNPTNNGGHVLDGYQWFRGADTLENETRAYVVLNGPATEYSAIVHGAETNVWHKLCDDGKTAAAQPASITAYPNPVKAGQPVTLNLPDGVDRVSVRIYDMNGNLKQQQSNVRQSVNMPNQHGIYLLQIQLPNGNIETQRIIVE